MQNSRQAYVNLGLATAAFAVAFAAWSLIAPLSRQIQADLNLDNTSIGLLIALPTLLGALMRVPMGVLTDRFGGRKVFTGLLLFTLLPIAFLGFAHSFWSYVIGAFFLGTAGASFAVGIPFVSRWFSADRQGTALGIYGVGNIGTAAAVLSMGPLMQLFGSRQDAFWFYLIPVAIMALLFWLFARDAPGTVQPQPLGASFATVSREPITWQLSLFYFVTFGGFVFFANYLPQLLGDWFPQDRENAGLQAAIFTMAATFARPVGGWLADRFGGAKVLTWVFAFIVITRLLLAWQAGHANIVIVTDLLFAVAVGFGFGNGAVFKLVAQYFPKNTGLISGVVGCAGGLGGFFPPLVMGFVRDHTGNYALAFVILAMLAAFCWVLLLARNSQRSDSRQAYINLALATAAFAVAFAAWNLIAPLSHQIQADLNLDNTSIDLLIALPTLLGALMRVPMGVLTDRFGGRKVFTGLLLFTLLPIAFLGFAHSFWSYVIGAFFLGIAGASFAVGIPFVSRWFSVDRQGTALGIYGVGNIGTAAAVLSMGPLMQLFGSRQDAFWFYLIPVAIMALLFWLFARDAPGTVQPQPLGASFATVSREPITWQLSLFYFVTFGGFVFFANYLPQLLGDWFPQDRENAGLQVAIFTMAATFARPIGGWLADLFGGLKVLTWVFVFLVITRLLLAWQAGHANIVIVTDLLFAVALGFGFGNGAVFKLVAQYFPNNTGLIGGVVGCAGGLGGFFPPLVMAFVLGYAGSYALGFVILAMLAALCWALLLARSPQPSDLRRAYVERNQS